MDSENTNKEPQSLLNTPLSRRKFLKSIGKITIATTTGALTGTSAIKTIDLLSTVASPPHDSKEPVIQSTIETPVEISEVEYIEAPGSTWPDGIKVAINKDGLPIKYVLPSGKEIGFDLDAVKKVRQEALDSQEPQILLMTEIPSNGKEEKKYRTPHEPTNAHPKVEKIPLDILTNEELKEKGITIIQSDKVHLYIRKSAFEESGPLYVFSLGKRELTIVLVDYPVVTKNSVIDRKYDKVRPLLGDNNDVAIQDFRNIKIAQAQEEVKEDRDLFHSLLQNSSDTNYLMHRGNALINSRMKLYEWINMVSDAEVYSLMVNEKREGHYAAGLYNIPRDLKNPVNATIFFAVGKHEFKTDLAKFFFDHTGKFGLRYIPAPYRNFNNRPAQNAPIDFIPYSNQTHPDPSNFLRNVLASPLNPKSYPYGAQSTGQVLRHEIAHDELITGNPQHPNTSEYDTDERAMKGITDAWKKWEDSEYTDDTGYSFVFKTDEDIILTSNPGTKQKILTT